MGYDGCCSAYYHLYDDEDDARNSFEFAYGFDFQNSNNIYRVGAPLLYQAQKWLREEKGIIISPAPYNDFKWCACIYRITIPDELCKEFDSFEEALSEGIKEAIKLLKEK